MGEIEEEKFLNRANFGKNLWVPSVIVIVGLGGIVRSPRVNYRTKKRELQKEGNYHGMDKKSIEQSSRDEH